jgi:hypothetical protein
MSYTDLKAARRAAAATATATASPQHVAYPHILGDVPDCAGCDALMGGALRAQMEAEIAAARTASDS